MLVLSGMGRVPESPWKVEPFALVSGPPMSRRSLRPQLNQIRGWVRQGRTDAWIAHQLEVTVQQIQAFKREQGLEPDADENGAPLEEVDLRAEDDAQIAAELEAEAARKAEEERLAAEEAARKAAEEEAQPPGRRRGGRGGREPKRAARRRGGRSRRRTAPAGPLEGTFDHGEEGYGLWLDPAVQDDPIYAEHWAGHRPVEITIEEDQIVIRRSGGGEDDETTEQPIAWRRAQDALACDRSSRGRTAPCCGRRRRRTTGTSNTVRVEDEGRAPPRSRRAGDELLAGFRHRKLDIEHEATGAAARPYFAARAGWPSATR